MTAKLRFFLKFNSLFVDELSYFFFPCKLSTFLNVKFFFFFKIPPDANRSAQPSPRNSAWIERNQEMWNAQETPSGLSMLTRCFDRIFTDLSLQVCPSCGKVVIIVVNIINRKKSKALQRCGFEFF